LRITVAEENNVKRAKESQKSSEKYFRGRIEEVSSVPNGPGGPGFGKAGPGL